MFNGIKQFHKELITPSSSISASRYMALVAFYVASWILIYLTWKTQVLPSEIFIGYISVFVLGYLGGKATATFGQKTEDKNETQEK